MVETDNHLRAKCLGLAYTRGVLCVSGKAIPLAFRYTPHTMRHTVQTVWAEKMAFDCHIGQHTLRLDTIPEAGTDTGPGPKVLLLSALSGCTAMDVVALLAKMRIPFDQFRVEAVAETTEAHPKVYTAFHLKYVIRGEGVREDKVRQAIELSQEKYCGVSAMLRAHAPITWELLVE
jgi:putative redox protein